ALLCNATSLASTSTMAFLPPSLSYPLHLRLPLFPPNVFSRFSALFSLLSLFKKLAQRHAPHPRGGLGGYYISISVYNFLHLLVYGRYAFSPAIPLILYDRAY